MIVRSIIYTLLGIAILLVPEAAGAKHLAFATDPFHPFYYQEGNSTKGLQYELAAMAFNKMHVSFDVDFMPWKRALLLAEAKKADGVFGLRKTKARKRWLIFPDEPLMTVSTVIFYRKGTNFEFEGLSSLRGKTIGVIKGYTYGEDFDNSPLFKTEEVATLKQNFLKLLAGRVDLVAAYKTVGLTAIRQMGLEDKISYDPRSVHKTALYVGFSKIPGNAAIVKEFSRRLKEVKDSPDCEGLLRELNMPQETFHLCY